MLARAASSFCRASLKHSHKWITAPVLPRFIETSSLLSMEDQHPIKTSVADYVVSKGHAHVISNIEETKEQIETVADDVANQENEAVVEGRFNVDEILMNCTETDDSVYDVAKQEDEAVVEESFNVDEILLNCTETDDSVYDVATQEDEVVLNSTDTDESVHAVSEHGETVAEDNVDINEVLENCTESEESVDNVQEETGRVVEENFNIDEMLLNSAESNDDGDSDDYQYEQNDGDVQAEILQAALENVPLYGWSMKSIETAVEALGLFPESNQMFKRGPLDLVLYFVEESNNLLIEHLAKQAKEVKLDTEEAQRGFIENAIKMRLQMIIPYIDTWPEALQLMASPLAAREVLENGTNLMDEICYHAGDLDTDLSWYAKRGALGGISLATELYMLNDKSVDYKDTWAFLNRRINEARLLNDVKESAKESLTNAPSDTLALIRAGIVTAQNMISLGSKWR